MKTILLTAIVVATVASCCAVDVWWESAVIYQIYPRSFKDSDGDGIGDLNGITSKLPYLRDLGIDAIWMSPIFLSPMYDFGYDITDYRQIAPEYGTMEDFDALMEEAKRLGIRVVLDYVPNHTSNESDWFVKSARRDEGYEDYYVWADGVRDQQGTLQPPNNWISIFRKSAWEYNAVRGQYYLHQFVIGQPDLNYRSPKVQQEMKDVLSFWLEKGVSGFRVDAINMMYEVDAAKYGGKFPDEPLSGDASSNPDDYNYLLHPYTKDQDETYNVVYDWRDLLDQFTARDGESKVMMTEAYTELPLMIRYYGNVKRNGSMPFNFLYLDQLSKKSTAQDIKLIVDKWMTYMPSGDASSNPDDYNYLLHPYTKDQDETYNVVYDWRDLLDQFTARDGESKVMMTEAYTELPLMIRYYGNVKRNGSMPFNFLYLDQLSKKSTAQDIKLIVDKWMTYMPSGKTANWVNGNHDQSRMANRHGIDRVDAMNMLSLMLPGLTITYQGEELGMTDGYVSWEDTKDPQACNTDDPVNYWKSSRDPNRTPFHWDGSRNAGFSDTTGATWLPVAENYDTVNVAVQQAAEKSHLKFYKDVVHVTKTPTVRYGDLATAALSENVFVVTRLLPNAPAYVAIMNLSENDEMVDLSNEKLLPNDLKVVASGVNCSLQTGEVRTKNNIPVSAHCAIVLQSIKNCC